MKDLKGKVAIVTGGSQGLGAAITEVLAEAGVKVVIGDVQEEKAKDYAAHLKKNGKEVEAMKLDVSDEDSIKEMIDYIKHHYGEQLDILINNAGIDITKPVDELSSREFERVINVNLKGPFLMSKYALKLMEQKRRGHIVNISSTAAKRSWANASAYHASKWGLLGMSHGLYVEAREKNIKVSAVVAGGMRTSFILERFPDTPLDKLQDPKNVAETVKFVLMQPDETIIPEVMVIPLMESSWP